MMKKKLTAKKLPAKVVTAKKKKPAATEERLAKKAALEAAAQARQEKKDEGPPQVDLKTFSFPLNCKFMNGPVLYTVTRVRKDSNTEWRTVVSAAMGDQDYMLDTLRKDALNTPGFMVLEVGNVDNTDGSSK